MDLADSSISSTLSAPASKVISAYPFLKDMIKTNKMLQSRLRKVRYEGWLWIIIIKYYCYKSLCPRVNPAMTSERLKASKMATLYITTNSWTKIPIATGILLKSSNLSPNSKILSSSLTEIKKDLFADLLSWKLSCLIPSSTTAKFFRNRSMTVMKISSIADLLRYLRELI